MVLRTETTPAKRLETMPVGWFRVLANVRKFFSKEELEELQASLRAEGQLQPLGAYKDGTLYWGQRRLMAATGAGLTHLDTYVFETPLSDTQVRIFQMAENLKRQEITVQEQVHGCIEILQLNPSWDRKECGKHLHVKGPVITRWLAYLDCVPEVQAAFDQAAVNLTQMYAISKAPPEQQHTLLAFSLAGATRDEVEKARRQQKEVAPANGQRTRRLKVPLPSSGVMVTIDGKTLTMPDLHKIAEELLKETTKGRKAGFEALTWARAMADKCKAPCSEPASTIVPEVREV